MSSNKDFKEKSLLFRLSKLIVYTAIGSALGCIVVLVVGAILRTIF